jgi:hypothetical protein
MKDDSLKTIHTDPTGSDVILPRLELLLTAHVKLGPIQKVGDIPQGVLRMIPILGGAFEGPRLRGKIVPGGVDWPIKRPDRITVIEAGYALQTDDGVLIRVRNEGLGVPPEDCRGRTYIRTVPRLEAPAGAYGWLNQVVLLGTLNAPGGADDEVVIRFFEVV